MPEQSHLILRPGLPSPEQLDIVEPYPGFALAGHGVLEASGVQLSGLENDRIWDYVLSKSDASAALSAAEELASKLYGKPVTFEFKDELQDDEYLHRELFYSATTGSVTNEEVVAAGTSVEFGGPTKRRLDSNALPEFKPDLVTNLERKTRLETESQQDVDALADVSRMPLASDSVGSVHISNLPSGTGVGLARGAPLREAAIAEAKRVIKDAGFLVWDGGTVKDYQAILDSGFRPRKVIYDIQMSEMTDGTYRSPDFVIHGVFQKQSE